MEQQIREDLAAGRRRQAFDQILDEYQTKVIRLAYSILGNRALAEEAAQEAFIRIWKSLDQFRGESALSTWIYAITRNVALTAARKYSKPMRSLEETGVRHAVDAQVHADQRPDRGLDILRLVQRLPEKYRDVIVQFYVEDRSYEEVARVLDMPLGTVKTFLYRARKELMEAVAEEQRKIAERSHSHGVR